MQLGYACTSSARVCRSAECCHTAAELFSCHPLNLPYAASNAQGQRSNRQGTSPAASHICIPTLLVSDRPAGLSPASDQSCVACFSTLEGCYRSSSAMRDYTGTLSRQRTVGKQAPGRPSCCVVPKTVSLSKQSLCAQRTTTRQRCCVRMKSMHCKARSICSLLMRDSESIV